MFIIFGAGLLKALSLDDFARSLESWTLLPPGVRPLVAVAVPASEMLLAGAWLVGCKGRVLLSAIIAMTLSFTAIYALHLALGRRPTCACFGAIIRFDEGQESARWVVGRNAVILTCLVPGFFRADRNRRPRAPETRADRPGGFTLIETILCIGLCGLLIALAAPTLARLRERSRDAVSLANLRSHAQVLALYEVDWQSRFPFFTDPKATWTTVVWNGMGFQMRFFDTHYRWQVAMAEGYYENVAPHPSQRRPGGEHVCSYYYSSTLVSDPAFWNPSTRTGPSQWRAIRADEVVFPSDKASFVEVEGYIPSRALPRTYATRFAMLDGSAQTFRLDQLAEPYVTGEGGWHGSFFHIGIFGMHTPDGVRGRDRLSRSVSGSARR